MSSTIIDTGAVAARTGEAEYGAEHGAEHGAGCVAEQVAGRGAECDEEHVPGCVAAEEPVEDVVHRLRARLEDDRRRHARRAGWTRRFVSTGLMPLDAALPQGGLPAGSVTEIVGDGYGVGAMALAVRIAASCGRTRTGGAPSRSPKETVRLGDRSDIPPYEGGIEGGRAELRNLPQPLLVKEGSAGAGLVKEGSVGGGRYAPDRCFSRPGSSVASVALDDHRCIVVVDTFGDFYPPAVLRYGITLDRLIVIRPKQEAEAFWAVDQSLRCSGVAAVIAPLSGLDERRSRRLQLAAESSGSIGLVIRPAGRRGKSFAATEMLVEGVAASSGHARLCRITLLKVREGTPAEPFLVNLDDETGAGPLPPVPVDGSVAKRA